MGGDRAPREINLPLGKRTARRPCYTPAANAPWPAAMCRPTAGLGHQMGPPTCATAQPRPGAPDSRWSGPDAASTPLGRGGCMCGADGYLLAKLVSSYSCPLTSGSWRRPWRWPGSSRRVGSQLAGSTRVPAEVRCPCVVRLAGAPSPWTLGSSGLMGEDSRRRGGASGLTDRRGERVVLDHLVSAVRAGGSRVLVVRGEPGVGKSALLDYLAGRASGCRVARAAGVESEMELVFAGLHQLLAPVLDHVEGCRCRSGRRCGPRSASARARRRTGSWWGWRCWGWCRRSPPSNR